MQLPVMPPVAPMLAKPVAAIPPGQFYEPKWDGFRSIVFRDGDEVEIGSRKERPMTRYFPEVVEAVRRSFPPRAVIDGEIVVAGDGGLDFWALQQRIHPAASRVTRLAGETPASFIAFDLLALGDDDLTGEPFAERRAALERALAAPAPPVHVTPITRDEAARARLVRALRGRRPRRADRQARRPRLPARQARDGEDQARADGGLRRSPATASTSPPPTRSARCCSASTIDEAAPRSQWGDHTRGLAPVGVIGAFPIARRRELFAELQPLVVDFAEHPWSWAAETGPGPEGGSRWNPGKDLSFVPLRPERVVEVRYDYLEGARFRHPPQFVRWRPDRDPASCGYAQLEQPTPFDLADVLAGGFSAAGAPRSCRRRASCTRGRRRPRR